MPATRSSSQQPRSHPFPTSSPPRSQYRTVTTASITVLPGSSSSEAESSRTVTKKQPRKRNEKPKPRSRPPAVIPEVIEISSDDEPLPPISKPTPATGATAVLLSEPATIAGLRRQIRRYREESAKYKRDFERASKELAALREENKELQALRDHGNGKITLDANKLTDHFDCEICTCRMWTPYILPGCGHTFCQNCLQDWFSTIQAQYMTNHPGYDPNQLISDQRILSLYDLAQSLLRNPQTAQTSALVSQLLPPHPQFTCPVCREPVKSRPTEAFALKALVRTVSATIGESSPKRSKQSGNASGESVWDGFFPRKKS